MTPRSSRSDLTRRRAPLKPTPLYRGSRSAGTRLAGVLLAAAVAAATVVAASPAAAQTASAPTTSPRGLGRPPAPHPQALLPHHRHRRPVAQQLTTHPHHLRRRDGRAHHRPQTRQRERRVRAPTTSRVRAPTTSQIQMGRPPTPHPQAHLPHHRHRQPVAQQLPTHPHHPTRGDPHDPPTALHRHQRRLRAFLRAEHRRHHHLLGQQPRRADRPAQRPIHRHHRRRPRG